MSGCFQDGDEIELKIRYLLVLGLVTVQPQLHLKDSVLAGEALQVATLPNQTLKIITVSKLVL
jgi:hypothetical protein